MEHLTHWDLFWLGFVACFIIVAFSTIFAMLYYEKKYGGPNQTKNNEESFYGEEKYIK